MVVSPSLRVGVFICTSLMGVRALLQGYRHATGSQALGVSPLRRSFRSRASFIRHEAPEVTTTTA